MSNVKIVSSCVQGLPTIITLTGSTVVPLASAVSIDQAGTGYFYAGTVVDSALLGNKTVIDRLVSLGAIAAA